MKGWWVSIWARVSSFDERADGWIVDRGLFGY